METKTFEAPAMFADHHVTEVRRILLEIPGVSDVYASSSFHVIEVTYDPALTGTDALQACLAQAGYLGDLPVLVESGVAVERRSGDAFFRHTATYETVKNTVSFAQRVNYEGRPLWPCPGMTPAKMSDD